MKRKNQYPLPEPDAVPPRVFSKEWRVEEYRQGHWVPIAEHENAAWCEGYARAAYERGLTSVRVRRSL